MSFSTAASSASSKAAVPSQQPASSGNFPVSSPNTTESSAQRRAGGSGNSGAGASSRNNPSPRNNQSQRKQHKGQKKAGWADEDAIAESAAMKSINSRKGQTSITHLMNFSLPPRPYFPNNSGQNPSHRQNQRKNPSWGIGSGYHATDKARYVQANYRFILLPDREYRAQAADADARLDWDAVMQVLASAETQSASCPICLSIPIAPRMAKCGHIFCLPCLIRFMHSTDDAHPQPERRARCKRCPICEDIIYVSETRPVRWFVGQEASLLREGGDVLLKLLARDSNSSLALPRDAMETHELLDDVPWYHVAEVMDHARFMKGGEEYMTAQYEQEIFQLQELEREDELLFGEDTTWTQKAVASISDAKDRLLGIGNPPDMVSQVSEKVVVRPPLEPTPDGDVPEMYHHQRATKSGQSLPSANALSKSPLNDSLVSSPSVHSFRNLPSATAGLSLNDRKIISPSHNTQHLVGKNTSAHTRSHAFYFYLALPNFFLSPLDIRILKTAYGSFSSFPSSLLPRVEHISTGHIVDYELRRRAKYTTHLPHGCEISFLECDWTDIISPSVLNTFADEINRRRKKNHDKEVREERERLRAEREEDDKKWAAARRKRPSLIDDSISADDFVPLNHERESSSLDAGHDFSRTPPRYHSSFASLASPGTSPEAPRTVWGTAAIHSPTMEPTLHEQPMDDGWLQGWEQDMVEHNDLPSKVYGDVSIEDSLKSPTAGAGLRKKKNKKITLMSTNARRGA